MSDLMWMKNAVGLADDIEEQARALGAYWSVIPMHMGESFAFFERPSIDAPPAETTHFTRMSRDEALSIRHRLDGIKSSNNAAMANHIMRGKPLTPEEAVESLGHWLSSCGPNGATASGACFYWTGKTGRRLGWHMTDRSVPIAENVIAVLSTLAAGHNREQCAAAALALLELTQLAIIGAGGHKGDHGSVSL